MSKVYAAKYKDGTTKMFDSWPECQKGTKGVPGVIFKSFDHLMEAEKWLDKQTMRRVDDNEVGLKIYVDGSFVNSIEAAGWAFAVVENDELIYEEYGATTLFLEARNITGECIAAKHAILWLKKEQGRRAQLIHDYVGLGAWLTGEWAQNSHIAKHYYQSCSQYVGLLDFVNIRGHQGNKWNDHVDKRARQGLDEFKGVQG